jgi:ABC-type sulfate transport system substrate-binding protein
MKIVRKSILLISSLLLLNSCGKKESGGTVKLLNVSYDPTREYYVDVNKARTAAPENRRVRSSTDSTRMS